MFEILSDTKARINNVTFIAGPGVLVHNFRKFDEPQPGRCVCDGSDGVAIRGVQLTFANGLTLSVMWGTGNYIDDRYDSHTDTSVNAELGLIRKNGEFIGDVTGWVSAEQVLALIPVIVGLPSDTSMFWWGDALALTSA